MASWKEIASRAGAAKNSMVRDWAAGEAAFQALLRAQPNDGMVFQLRGEAYEALGETELACRDYERAEQLFPLDQYKNQARQAGVRLGC
jgi:Flp pilus assembly protein TadD